MDGPSGVQLGCAGGRLQRGCQYDPDVVRLDHEHSTSHVGRQVDDANKVTLKVYVTVTDAAPKCPRAESPASSWPCAELTRRRVGGAELS